MSNIVQPTSIIDKNGVHTTRHKRVEPPAISRLGGLAASPPRFLDDPSDVFNEVNDRMYEGINGISSGIQEKIAEQNSSDITRLSRKLSALSESMTIWENITAASDNITAAQSDFRLEVHSRISQSSPTLNDPEISGYSLALGFVQSANFSSTTASISELPTMEDEFREHLKQDVVLTHYSGEKMKGVLTDNFRHDMYFLVKDGVKSERINLADISEIELDPDAPIGSFVRRDMSASDKMQVAMMLDTGNLVSEWTGVRSLAAPGNIDVIGDDLYNLTNAILHERLTGAEAVSPETLTGILAETTEMDLDFSALKGSPEVITLPIEKLREYAVEIAVAGD